VIAAVTPGRSARHAPIEDERENRQHEKDDEQNLGATPTALAAIPPQPKTAATSTMTKNIAAQYNTYWGGL
jgi:hypothetical protein